VDVEFVVTTVAAAAFTLFLSQLVDILIQFAFECGSG
jgi:hypothetical protein